MRLIPRLISTDFDGTVFCEGDRPSVPAGLQRLLAELQAEGATWVINTGRDLASLRGAMAQAELRVQPDYVVVVEREIHRREGGGFVGLTDWNDRCTADHATLFAGMEADVPGLFAWIREEHEARVYADLWSPLCFIAASNTEAEAIEAGLLEYCQGVPDLTVVRNDVYARFSHTRYNKGTALAEIARRHGLGPESVLAAGDHLNDLPMLSRDFAHWLLAPVNAVPQVKEAVRSQGGLVTDQRAGWGLEAGLRQFLERP